MLIGVDIGGTNLLVGTIEDGQVVHKVHERICENGNFEKVANQVSNLIYEVSGGKRCVVGISVAGSIDPTSGIVLRAQNLDWDNAPLASTIQKKTDCHVLIENDVTSAAWGEFNFGAGRDVNSMFVVWIGTGIGGGLILDGEIWRGPLGTGGEFGMGISEQNPNSEIRVLEEFSSRSGIQRQLHNTSLDSQNIADLFGVNDELTAVVTNGAKRIGTSIANVITLLSLDRVVLGGGLTEVLGIPYIDHIRTQFEQDVFPSHCKQCTFKVTELGPDAGLLGAGLLASTMYAV